MRSPDLVPEGGPQALEGAGRVLRHPRTTAHRGPKNVFKC